MRRMRDARGGCIGLRKDSGTIRKGIGNGRKLAEYVPQAALELLICLYQLILPKILVRELCKIGQ